MDTVPELVEKLPLCERCRQKRIRCTQSSAGCEACVNSDSECEIFDHVLQRSVSTKSLFGLLERLHDLDARLSTANTHHSSRDDVDDALFPNGGQNQHNESEDGGKGRTLLPLNSFGYLSIVSDLVELRDEAVEHLERTQATPKSFHNMNAQAFGMKPSTASQSLPFPEDFARYLFHTYKENVEVFLPVFGRSLNFDDALRVLFQLPANDGGSEVPHNALIARLSLAVALVLLASSTHLNLCEESQSQLRAHSFLHWAEVVMDSALAHVKNYMERRSSHEDDGELTRTAKDARQRKALDIVRLLLLLVMYSLFLPQKGSSRQLLGFADRIFAGHYETVHLARDSVADIHPEFLPSSIDPQLYSDISQVHQTFLTLEQLVAMTDGLPISHLHSTYNAASSHAENDNSIDSTQKVSMLFARLVYIKYSKHVECLDMLHSPAHNNEKARPSRIEHLRELLSSTETQLKEWLDQWIETAHMVPTHSDVESSTSSENQAAYLEWLILYGQVLRDEACLHAFRCCMSVAYHWITDIKAYGIDLAQHCSREDWRGRQDSRLDHFNRFAKQYVISMGTSYTDLLLVTRCRSVSNGLDDSVPLLYLCTWPWSLQVFDLALTTILLSKWALSSNLAHDTTTPRLVGSVETPRTDQAGNMTSSSSPAQASWTSNLDLSVRLLLACGQTNPSSARALTEAIIAVSTTGR